VTKTVLFDLDGTLLDTEKDFTRVLNSQLASYGFAPVQSIQVRNSVSSGARALIKLGYNIDESHEKFSAYLEEFLDRYETCISHTECDFFPGIASMLDALNKAGIPWGIVTNKPSRFTLPLIKNFPILSSSGVVICADHVKNSKPDPEGILLACERMGSNPVETIYVGDHLKDVQATAAAGATSIAVRWGYIPDELPIEDWQADHLINHPDEILAQAIR
jgi:2-phosphoglycolate phosphatase|tara:strand:+ start:939 stop:1595 length:657 start_codon:yes stop_codon:yes gene_type:complete